MINFPSNPQVNDVYQFESRTWTYDGSVWRMESARVGFIGSAGYTGSQGIGYTGSAGFTGSQGIGYTGSTGNAVADAAGTFDVVTQFNALLHELRILGIIDS